MQNFKITDSLRTIDQIYPIKFDQDKTNPNVTCSTSKEGITIINNILSENECANLIKNSNETGYNSMKHEYPDSIRDNRRILCINNKLATVLWNRISNHFKSGADQVPWGSPRASLELAVPCGSPRASLELAVPCGSPRASLELAVPCGFGVEGKWVPVGINPCFRFSQYIAPSIGFEPHRDAYYIKDEHTRSIYTIIIYLNNEFENGNTIFHEAKRQRVPGETVKEELADGYDTYYDYKPVTGSAIIFNHNTIHQGLPVTKGLKYIIRSDIVFRRIAIPKNYNYNWLKDMEYQIALNLQREAGNQELEGNVDAAAECYERALSFRQCYKRVL
jgi:hypothetical protein